MPLPDFSKKGKWATVSDKLRKYDTCNFMKIRRLVFVLIFLPKYYIIGCSHLYDTYFLKIDLCLFVCLGKAGKATSL